MYGSTEKPEELYHIIAQPSLEVNNHSRVFWQTKPEKVPCTYFTTREQIEQLDHAIEHGVNSQSRGVNSRLCVANSWPRGVNSQGRRRLELFGEDHNIRRGWVTLGQSLSASNFNPETYAGYFRTDRDHRMANGNPTADAPQLVCAPPVCCYHVHYLRTDRVHRTTNGNPTSDAPWTREFTPRSVLRPFGRLHLTKLARGCMIFPLGLVTTPFGGRRAIGSRRLCGMRGGRWARLPPLVGTTPEIENLRPKSPPPRGQDRDRTPAFSAPRGGQDSIEDWTPATKEGDEAEDA
eukprot:1193104-Prorocentrum_minimum.AAC.1